MTAGAEQKGLEVLSRVDHDVPDLLIGDPLRPGQVLINLLSNDLRACRLVNRLTSPLPLQPDLQKLERHIDDLSFPHEHSR